MKAAHYIYIVFGILFFGTCAVATLGWTPLAVANDPLVRMPGTQPKQTTLEAPARCLNCHSNYNSQVEPGFNWKGSMMAQAGRDFLFWSCQAVAAQDSIHALGRPNAVDLCERCHFPSGWLEGRSDPPNASAMTGADFDGVHCDACHRQYNPFFDTTHAGTREGLDWLGYWDEATSASQTAANTTYAEDTLQAMGVKLFNGGAFFLNMRPAYSTYDENGGGQYFISGGNQKRASFADANAKHQVLYSRYHKSKFFCGTCHDVSNPALANLSQNGTTPGSGTTVLNSEKNSAYSFFHVERTFSEFRLSAYGGDGGTDGVGPFAPGVFKTSLVGNKIGRCQDCHMRDVEGVACDKAGSIFRPTGSSEHRKSGQPLHDMTGGNIFVSYILASTVVGSPNYDATNAALLGQGPTVLTLDLTQGEGVNPQALLAGVDRAKQQLNLAAAIENMNYDSATGQMSFRIRNQTGHRLISGFPEGRRMFVNIKAFRQGSLSYEVNPYDPTADTLKGLGAAYSPNSPALGTGEVHMDELVYEMHPTSTITGEEETFHFALATGRYKDNRIPPKGFRISEAPGRQCEPVWHGVSDTSYYTAAEYQGGYDDVSLNVARGADAVQVTLYYQTTSREYIEFLRDEITGNGRRSLPDSAYIAQTDPFFTKLKAWGTTIWQLWDHNRDLPGSAPYPMAQASIAVTPSSPPAPTLQYVEPGNGQVTLHWSDVHSSDPSVVGYKVYYDQAGKAQLVAQVGMLTSYTDANLIVGQLHCYKVTSVYGDGTESSYSNTLCVVPAPLVSIGQAKGMAEGSWVYVRDAVVTAGNNLGWGHMFAQSPMRTSGIKLFSSESLASGQNVGFTGLVSRVDGEWHITDLRLLKKVAGDQPKALGMTTKAIGNNIAGTLDYKGVNTTGLLVRTSGKVTSTIAPGRIVYINDGSNLQDALGLHPGIRVQYPLGVELPTLGSNVSVTGISRIEKQVLADWTDVNGQWLAPGTTVYVPSIWVRDSADVTNQ